MADGGVCTEDVFVCICLSGLKDCFTVVSVPKLKPTAFDKISKENWVTSTGQVLFWVVVGNGCLVLCCEYHVNRPALIPVLLIQFFLFT